MVKQIIIILALLLCISGAVYYGYTLYSGSNQFAFIDTDFDFLDGGMSEIEAFSAIDEDILEIESKDAELGADTKPVTTADLDSVLKEIDTVTTTNYNANSIVLTDL